MQVLKCPLLARGSQESFLLRHSPGICARARQHVEHIRTATLIANVLTLRAQSAVWGTTVVRCTLYSCRACNQDKTFTSRQDPGRTLFLPKQGLSV